MLPIEPQSLLTPLTTLGAGDAPLDPTGHVVPWYVNGGGELFSVSIQVLSLLIAGALTIVLVNISANAIATGPESAGNQRYVTKGRFSQIFEVITLYLRNNIIRPQLHEHADRYLPILLTTFYFILTCNLFGLVPLIDLQYLIGKSAVALGYGGYYTDFKVIGGTPTGTLATTAALATVAFFIWNAQGIRVMGLGGWLKHFTGGTPVLLWPIMIVVEIIGLFVKPFALTIRLMANMTAGHILLAVLIGFVGLSATMLTGAIGQTGGLIAALPIMLVSLVAATAIFFLEVFVALLQAFIFMFLFTIFLAQMSHHHDDHDDAHEDEFVGTSAADLPPA